ncbi:hypothetical protein [Streptomyces sp. NPDC058304]|uniref:hypothetical protein n=1 Tax=Streptomyces sp. NPDC058304 TaxID=3346437 RepID=UPI0036ECB23E
MKPRIRLAVLAPVLVSSLALGSAPLLAASAQAAAVPSLTCSVKQTPNAAGKYDVTATGAQPGTTVTFRGGTATNKFTATTHADDDGKATTSGFIPVGKVTAATEDEKVSCGTVKEAEQQDAQAQYSKGFRKGLAETQEGCKKKPQNQNLAQLDPNYEKGYNAGAAAALNSKACQEG